MQAEFTVRVPVPDDVEFMLKTWGREIERTHPRKYTGKSALPKRIFYNEFQKIMLTLVQRCHARVVAPLSDLSTIANFTIANVYPDYATTLIHFAYTRPAFRRLGLCKAALLDMGTERNHELVATHWTRLINKFEVPQMLYNPYVLYRLGCTSCGS